MYLNGVATLTRIENVNDKVVITTFKKVLSASFANLLSVKVVHAGASNLSLPLAYVYKFLHAYANDHKSGKLPLMA